MTSDGFLESETRAAIDALVHRLKNRGDADDEPFAAEFIAALKGRGWRPTNARPLPDWHYRKGGTPPDADRPGGADYLEVKAQVLAKARAATGEQPAVADVPERPP